MGCESDVRREEQESECEEEWSRSKRKRKRNGKKGERAVEGSDKRSGRKEIGKKRI